MAKRQGDGVILTDVTSKGLNTFGGVFTPSILTILGVIMYWRSGGWQDMSGSGQPC